MRDSFGAAIFSGKTRPEFREDTAEKLLEDAQVLRNLGDEKFGNGLGIVAIHAAIAMCDAVTIRIGGYKHQSGDHTGAADLLADVVADVPPQAIRGLRDALRAKDNYSYTGQLYQIENAARLLEGVERFFEWARTRLR